MTYFRTTWNDALRFTGLALAVLVVLFLIFDSVEHARIVAAYEAESFYMVRLAGYRFFTAATMLLPLAGIFGPLTLLFLRLRRGETQVLMALGQSTLRRALPFVMLGLLLATLQATLACTLAPWAAGRYRQTIDEDIKHKPQWGEKWRPAHEWYRGPSGSWRMERKDETSDSFRDVLHFRENPDGSLRFVLEAERLEWRDGKWIWHHVRRTSVDETEFLDRIEEHLPETPRHFRYGWEQGDELSPWDLAACIEWKTRQGHSVAKLETQQTMQLALPFLTFWFPLAAFAIAGSRKIPRGGRIFGLGFAAGLAAFVFLQATSHMAGLGWIGVSIAALIPGAFAGAAIFTALWTQEGVERFHSRFGMNLTR